jgi:hypothetical protein
MSPNDRRHAIAVARTLQYSGYNQPALMQAALLHDVAKSIGQPLIHRILIVLLKAFWPAALDRLAGRSTTQPGVLPQMTQHLSFTIPHPVSWWRRPFAVHAYHPEIGAVWAEEAQCDSLAIELIRRHQDRLADNVVRSPQQELLAALQWADNLN